MQPSQTNSDFEWWDIDGDDLGGALYAVISPIQLGDRDYTSWDEFRAELPGCAYAWLVATEHRALDDALISLRIVQKLFSIETLPLKTRVGGSIGREEWLRLSIDVGLFRFASIRDQAQNLVAVLYELDLPSRNRSLDKIRRQGVPRETVDLLESIGSVGRDLRIERNARAHDGRQRPLGHDPFFKIFSIDEASRGELATQPKIETMGWAEDELVTLEHGSDYDFIADYEELVEGLADDFLPECRVLATRVRELVDLLATEFEERYVSRRSALDPPLFS